MYLILTASKDTYITNRKLESNDAKFANVGNAASLDLFKLKSENKNVKPTAILSIQSIPDPGDSFLLTDINGNAQTFTYINGDSNIVTKEISLTANPTLNGITTETQNVINGSNLSFSVIEKSNNTIILEQDKKGFTAETSNTSSTSKIKVENFVIKEFSKVLIYFSLDEIKNVFNINHSKDFSAKLKLFDISTGIIKPKNFSLSVFPLSKSFDEGIGNDIYSFGHLGVANFLTSSRDDNTLVYNTWNLSGARSKGGNKSLNIDIITGSNNVTYNNSQLFTKGDENLSIDITNFISESLSGQITNNGFCIEFSNNIDQNNNTYFVKRFGSRHIKNKIFVPRIDFCFDDSFTKPDSTIYTNSDTKVYLENRQGNFYKDLFFTGSNLLDTTKNQLSASLSYKEYTKNIFATQSYDALGQKKSGSYFINLNIDMFESPLHGYLTSSGDLDANINWYVLVDENPSLNTLVKSQNIKITTGSNIIETEKFLISDIRYDFNLIGTSSSRKFLVSFIDTIANLDAIKIPYRRKGENVGEAFYSVIDAHTNKEIIPFETKQKGTKMSYEDGDYYFTLHNTDILKDRIVKFKFFLKDYNNLEIKNQKTFRI